MHEWLNRLVGPEGALLGLMAFSFVLFLIGLGLARAERKHVCKTCGHKDFRHMKIGCVLCRCDQFISGESEKLGKHE